MSSEKLAEFAVTGISGKFPKCENVAELKEKLLNGVELPSSNIPWIVDDDFPKRIGKIRTFREFDNGYFGVLPKHADEACPMSRMELEAAYEAIIDAGVNPDTLKNSDTGVYIGTCGSESCQAMLEDFETRNVTRSLLTIAASTYSSRTSFWLGSKGPSLVGDTGCSTGLTMLDLALGHLQSGLCSQALVGAANMIALPYQTRLMLDGGYLSKEGRCFSFDEAASGFVRSEAVAMVFIQRVDKAKRIYCKIVGSRIGGEGYKVKGITQTSGPGQVDFLKLFYQQIKFNPLDVGYVEAHGPGTKAGDPEEAFSLDTIFNNGRSEPLAIGSVKSALGHCEPAAGIAGLIKVILAMECGTMPGTIHFKKPNPDIPSLVEGRLRVDNKSTEFNAKYVAVNSFGLGGTLAHVLIERHEKKKQIRPKTENQIPWMVVCSGRTQQAVEYMCEQVTTGAIDHEVIGLMHNIHSQNVKNHLYRGYSVAGNHGNITGSSFFSGEQRPVVFAFTGMGSQWFRMGKELLQIPVFARAIEKCSQVLKPKKVDLLKIITVEEPGLFDFILNSFVGIIAIQIALVDVLYDLGIKPDIIIGQSLGELSAAYADGALTLEQTILSAFYRGLVSVESVFVPGTMAAVGMSSEDLRKILPDDVEIACFNGPRSQIISGKKAAVLKFCKILEGQKVFVKEVPWACGIPYHSSFLSKPGAKFLDYLKEVIPEPKKRSAKWISSSIPVSKWGSHLATFSSAEYHFNNFCSPVLFQEAFQTIPDNAVVIEIAPHGLMESVIKQFGKRNLDYISVSDKKLPNLEFFLSALGRIYMTGATPQIAKLYPPVSFPVSRGTRMISPLVRWDHSQLWHIPIHDDLKRKGRVSRVLTPAEMGQNCVIDGVSVYPASHCLVEVWQALARMHGKKYLQLPVMFQNVQFHRPMLITEAQIMHLDVKKETGHFEVALGDQLYISGNVTAVDPAKEKVSLKVTQPRPNKFHLPLKKEDIYKELRLRGHVLSDAYKIASSVDFSVSTAEFEWNGDWSIAMECLAHFLILQKDTRLIQKAVKIQKIILDPLQLPDSSNQKITCYFDNLSGIISCDIIQITGIKFSFSLPKVTYPPPLLEKNIFVPHIRKGSTLYDAVHLCMHLSVENISTNLAKILEYRPGGNKSDALAPHIKMAFDNVPQVQCEISSFGMQPIPGVQSVPNTSQIPQKSLHILLCNVDAVEPELFEMLHPNGFLIVDAKPELEISVPGFVPCVDHTWDSGRLVMLKRKIKKNTGKIINLQEEIDYKWLKTIQEAENTDDNLLLVANNPTSGMLGMIYTLVQEMGSEKVRCVLTIDDKVPPFSMNEKFYAEQLEKNLTVNVFKNGGWGSYRHIPIIIPQKECCQVIRTSQAFVEGPLNRSLFKEGDLVTVQFSTVSSSKLSYVEYSGKDKNGVRVMGYQKQTTESFIAPSKILPDRETLWPVPAKWSMNNAAASVIPYCKALAAMQLVENVSTEKTVLVVGADYCDGFAMLSLALHIGCQVYATCDAESGVETLRALLPKLAPGNVLLRKDVGDLRNKYQAIDLIVCLAKKISFEETSSLRKDGTLLLFDDVDDIRLDYLPESASIKKINMSTYLEERKNHIHYALQALLEANLPPIRSQISTSSEADFKPETDFNPDKMAFERRVVQWRLEKLVKPRVWFDACQSFVIIGGLGGFGLELINWMVGRGASKFVVCSRSSVKTGYQAFRLRNWKANGIDVIISNEDITSENGAKAILLQALSVGPVGGVFQLALALEMGVLHNLTEEMFHQMTATRFLAAKFFDTHSRKLCPELQHFVMFSSYVSGRGNLGQANYAYASSRMDRLMEIRKADGLPTLSIQWGPIGEVGALADAVETGVKGTDFQHIASCLEVLDSLLYFEEPVVGSCVLQPKTAVKTNEKTVAARVAELMGIRDISTVPPLSTLAELGMDSILAVNIKTALADDFHLVVSLADIRNLTFAKCTTLSS